MSRTKYGPPTAGQLIEVDGAALLGSIDHASHLTTSTDAGQTCYATVSGASLRVHHKCEWDLPLR